MAKNENSLSPEEAKELIEETLKAKGYSVQNAQFDPETFTLVGELGPAFIIPKSSQKKSPANSATAFAKNIESKKKYTEPPRWVQSDETVEVGGYVIKGGLFYFGTNDDSVDDDDAEPSLIDPNLIIAKPSNRDAVETWGWNYTNLNYKERSPSRRGSYLKWLAGGRCDPYADYTDILLFLCGLERRLLIDGVDAQERAIIKAEAERLKVCYDKKENVALYKLEEFIGLFFWTELGEKLYEKPLPKIANHRRDYDRQFYIHLVLSQLARDKLTLPALYAWEWLRYDNNIIKRGISFSRCPEVFKELFMLRYQFHYETGMKLAKTKKKMTYHYYKISSVPMNTEKIFGEVLYTSMINKNIRRLQELFNECSEMLNKYSRVLGKYKMNAEALAVKLALPLELRREKIETSLQSLKKDMAVTPLIISVSNLLARFGEAEFSKDALVALGEVLRDERIDTEPALIAPITIKGDDTILLHAMPADAKKISIGPEYQNAVLTLQLAVAVACADGAMHENELAHLEEHLEHWEKLSPYYASRLRAHLHMMIAQPIPFVKFKKRLAQIPENDKRSIIEFVTQITTVDGPVGEEEHDFLEKLYKAFGFDSAELYSFLHKSEILVNSPRPKTGKKNAKMDLDHEKIANLKEETKHVSALLANIFDEGNTEKLTQPVHNKKENIPASVKKSSWSKNSSSNKNSVTAKNKVHSSKESVQQKTEALLGLDEAHSKFLHRLMQQAQWERKALVSIASELDLMLDGAIESINEKAFEKFDEPLIEGDDLLEINLALKETIYT